MAGTLCFCYWENPGGSLRGRTLLSRNYLLGSYARQACHNSSCRRAVMKGQKLFIRAVESSDHDAVRGFLHAEQAGDEVPACALLGKLVGELVAIIGMQVTADAIQIDQIVVKRDFRKK